jgi:hypothetical protein
MIFLPVLRVRACPDRVHDMDRYLDGVEMPGYGIDATGLPEAAPAGAGEADVACTGVGG